MIGNAGGRAKPVGIGGLLRRIFAEANVREDLSAQTDAASGRMDVAKLSIEDRLALEDLLAA